MRLPNKCAFYETLLLVISLIALGKGQYYVTDTSKCVFPFEYNGKTYNECIFEESKYPWCSLTSRFKGVWQYCQDMTITDWKCDANSKCEAGTAFANNLPYPQCIANNGESRFYCDIKRSLDLSKKPVGQCSEDYRNISALHTACLAPSANVAKRGCTAENITEILELHNNYRREPEHPFASNMQKMYWDNELAKVAQKHADRCSFVHDNMDWRAIPATGNLPGQNIVRITGNQRYDWKTAFGDMFSGEMERWDWGKGINRRFRGKSAYHYTQIMFSDIARVGCGYSECLYPDRLETLFVCNYNKIQMVDSNGLILKPWDADKKACELCPDSCVNKLCDCKGKECLNGGDLDPNACTCNCNGFWTGTRCETAIVPKVNDLGCFFPFMFKGKLEYNCMTDPRLANGKREFCSKTEVFQGKFEYCNDNDYY